MNAKESQIELLKAIQEYATCSDEVAEFVYVALLNRLSEHEQQLCLEQRENCALNIDQKAIYCGEQAIIMRIKTAPQPL